MGARRRAEDEVMLLGERGYVPTTQIEDGGHVHVGRLLLTSGVGDARSRSEAMTWVNVICGSYSSR
jgi:hypothetical protein